MNRFSVLHVRMMLTHFGRCTDPKHPGLLWVDNGGRYTRQEWEQAEESRKSWRQ